MRVSDDVGMSFGLFMFATSLLTSCKADDFMGDHGMFRSLDSLQRDRIEEIRSNADLTDEQKQERINTVTTNFSFAKCGY